MNDTLESEYQSRYDVDLYDIRIVLFSLENKSHHGQHSRLLGEILADVPPISIFYGYSPLPLYGKYTYRWEYFALHDVMLRNSKPLHLTRIYSSFVSPFIHSSQLFFTMRTFVLSVFTQRRSFPFYFSHCTLTWRIFSVSVDKLVIFQIKRFN